MNNKKTIRLALDVLEKEMAVLSSSEIQQILGGNGPGPLADGYCTFNNLSHVLGQLGYSIPPSNVLGNFTASYGTSSFSFNSSGAVQGVSTASGSSMETFQNNLLNMNSLSSTSGIVGALQNGNPVTISGAGANGHAYTIQSFDANTNKFTFLDTTTGTTKQVENTSQGMSQYVNAKEVTGVKTGVFGSSGSWTSADQSSVSPPTSTGSGSTGRN